MKYKLIFVTDRCVPLQTSLILSSWNGFSIYVTSGSTPGNVFLKTLVGLSGKYCSWDWGTSWNCRSRSYIVIIEDTTNHQWPKQLSKECWKLHPCRSIQKWGASARLWKHTHNFAEIIAYSRTLWLIPYEMPNLRAVLETVLRPSLLMTPHPNMQV